MIGIKGKIVSLKSVTLNDTEFILELRQDLDLNKFISATSPNIKD